MLTYKKENTIDTMQNFFDICNENSGGKFYEGYDREILSQTITKTVQNLYEREAKGENKFYFVYPNPNDKEKEAVLAGGSMLGFIFWYCYEHIFCCSRTISEIESLVHLNGGIAHTRWSAENDTAVVFEFDTTDGLSIQLKKTFERINKSFRVFGVDYKYAPLEGEATN